MKIEREEKRWVSDQKLCTIFLRQKSLKSESQFLLRSVYGKCFRFLISLSLFTFSSNRTCFPRIEHESIWEISRFLRSRITFVDFVMNVNRNVIKSRLREIRAICDLPLCIYDFIELVLELMLIVKVNVRYETAVEFLDLIKIEIERWCVADAQDWHRMMNGVLNVALATVRYVENDFRMSWNERRR